MMNFWKPLALVSSAALVMTIASGAARADSSGPKPETVSEAQPNMQAALTSLRTARASLARAEHDKGGWRAAALQATENAIKETERGIAYADKH
jgi:hypothetical protein